LVPRLVPDSRQKGDLCASMKFSSASCPAVQFVRARAVHAPAEDEACTRA